MKDAETLFLQLPWLQQGQRNRVRGKSSCPLPHTPSVMGPHSTLLLSPHHCCLYWPRTNVAEIKKTMRRCKGCQAAGVPFSSLTMPVSLVDVHFEERGSVERLTTPQIQIVLLALRQKNIQQESPHHRSRKVSPIRSRTLFFNLELLLKSL